MVTALVSQTVADEYQLLIDGAWRRGGAGAYGVVNPATEQVVGEAPEASVHDAIEAAAAARLAFPQWSRTPLRERAALLRKVAERLQARSAELVPLIMAETGATLSVGSRMQVPVAVERFDRYSRITDYDLQIPLPPNPTGATPLAPGGLIGGVVQRAPVGVVGCISPYNFPLVNMAGKVAPALVAGNTVVMKAPMQDPLAIIELARICEEVGFPKGVVNVITSASPDPAAALVASTDVDMISFTGSTGVGVRINEAGAKSMKRMLLELGGKGACLVFDDADIASAVTCLVSTWAFHSGQICTAPTRAVVHRKVYDELVAKLTAAAPHLKVGPPTDATTVIGPVISAAQRDRVESYIKLGRAEGGDVLVDGTRPTGPGLDTGYYVGPTLIAGCRNDMRVVREEIFGPVIVVVAFDDDEQGVALANDCDFGLYNYVFTKDTARGYDVAKRLRSGHVGINTAQRNAETPFGGFKMSGIGRDGGMFGIHAYTELQSIVWPG